jgi:uncharacterized protein YutE (UPF0331/DUF86 family)
MLGKEAISYENMQRLSCLECRNHIIERYCAIELKEYRRIFRSNDEVRFCYATVNIQLILVQGGAA